MRRLLILLFIPASDDLVRAIWQEDFGDHGGAVSAQGVANPPV